MLLQEQLPCCCIAQLCSLVSCSHLPAVLCLLNAVDLSAGVYYQKCYDPECRHYRSNYMPLPTEIWHAYQHIIAPPEQQQPQQQQALVQQQQEEEGALAAAAEDEECLRLLLQCEQHTQKQQPSVPVVPSHSDYQPHSSLVKGQQQQAQRLVPLPLPQQQQQQQRGSLWSDQQRLHSSASQQQQWQLGGGLLQAEEGPAQQAVDSNKGHQHSTSSLSTADAAQESGLDEDELCMQLLQDVEQQVAAQHQLAAGRV
jgi:hypothetical protein